MPIVRKYGQLYLKWSSKHISYTRPELLKLHRHCRHPSTDRIYALIKRAMPKQAGSTTRRILEDISRSCETSQTFSIPPQRFRVSFPPDEVTFNREVALDVKWIDKKAVQHIVDLETNFNAATFLKRQTVEGV